MAAPAMAVVLPTMTERREPLADVVAAARRAEDLGFESAWAVDQLVAGTGVPFIDSTVALSAAAGATSNLRLGYGVMVLPLRPVVWAAKQVASLQAVSGGRVLFGVGVGGDRHDLSWDAVGVPRRERGRRTDAALAVLSELIAGKAVYVEGRTIQLSPGVAVPPIIVGGTADAALARTARHADGWYSLPLPPPQIAASIARLAELAGEIGRPTPAITASVMVAIEGDSTLPDDDGLVRRLSDPNGLFGIPADAARDMVVTGGPPVVAERISALRAIGAERIVVSIAAGDWDRQSELIAEAVALVD
jgi:alkanesulfonate monooxygenase SsuD/methylene tetrahydromethanopterin reductase-like flavin-dependent oxidoreductase (luciferase family)